LIIKKVNSNIFITLCDLQQNVIISKSSGTVRSLGSNKKRKISPQAIEGIMRSLKKYFILYNITALNLCLKLSKCAHLFVLLKELRLFSIQIISIIDIKRVPHNGMRVRKMRRI
jgi:ribosomal protein S11